MMDSLVCNKKTFVDVGCGEGIVSLFVRLILKKSVICCDNQKHYLNMISIMKTLLLITHVNTQQTYHFLMMMTLSSFVFGHHGQQVIAKNN